MALDTSRLMTDSHIDAHFTNMPNICFIWHSCFVMKQKCTTRSGHIPEHVNFRFKGHTFLNIPVLLLMRHISTQAIKQASHTSLTYYAQNKLDLIKTRHIRLLEKFTYLISSIHSPLSILQTSGSKNVLITITFCYITVFMWAVWVW